MKSASNNAPFASVNKALQVEGIVALLLCIALFISQIIRAFVLPITPDEAYTFMRYVLPGEILPWNAHWDANNHLLNTLLTKVSNIIFGNGLLAIRLPNVIAYGLYLYATILIASSVQNKIIRWGTSITLVCAPLILELFALSRGYGLSFALLLWSIAKTRQLTQFQTTSNLYKVIVAGILMTMANLSLLPFFILQLAFAGLIFFKHNRRNLIHFLPALASICYFVWYGINLKSKGLLYYGSNDFLEMTLAYTTALMIGFEWTQWLFILLFAAWLIALFKFLKSIKKGKTDPDMIMFHTFIAIFIWVSVIAQHFLLGTPFPQDRTALHLYIISLVAFGILIDKYLPAFKWFFPIMAITTAIGATKAGFVSSIWQKDSLPKEIMAPITAFMKERQQPAAIASSYKHQEIWQYMNFMSETFVPFSNPTHLNSGLFDFALIKKDEIATYPNSRTLEITNNSAYTLISLPPAQRQLISHSRRILNADELYINLFSSDSLYHTRPIRIDIQITLDPEETGELYLVCFEVNDSADYNNQIDLSELVWSKDGKTVGKISFSQVFANPKSNKSGIYIWNKSRRLKGVIKSDMSIFTPTTELPQHGV